MALQAVLGASVGPVDRRRNEMARWVDYYLGRRGGPRAHPTGQPGAMAPQRRGAVAAPSRDPTRQATLPPGRGGTITRPPVTTAPLHHTNLAIGIAELLRLGRRCGFRRDSATPGAVGPYRRRVPRVRRGRGVTGEPGQRSTLLIRPSRTGQQFRGGTLQTKGKPGRTPIMWVTPLARLGLGQWVGATRLRGSSGSPLSRRRPIPRDRDRFRRRRFAA
jgi:hypothetical protein